MHHLVSFAPIRISVILIASEQNEIQRFVSFRLSIPILFSTVVVRHPEQKPFNILAIAHFVYFLTGKLVERVMSATDETKHNDASAQNQVDIDAIREHLLNYRYK